MGFYKNIIEGVKRRLSVPAEMTLGGTTVLDYITIDMTSRGKVYTFAKVVDMPVTQAPNYDVHGFNIHPDATISNPERLQVCTVHEKSLSTRAGRATYSITAPSSEATRPLRTAPVKPVFLTI